MGVGVQGVRPPSPPLTIEFIGPKSINQLIRNQRMVAVRQCLVMTETRKKFVRRNCKLLLLVDSGKKI